MLNQLLDLLKIGGALLIFIAVWLVTIAIVFRDVNRRNMNGIEQFLWLAAVALIPLLGFLIYWVARFLARLLLTEPTPAEDPRLRLTAVRPAADPQGRRFQTIAGQEPMPQQRPLEQQPSQQHPPSPASAPSFPQPQVQRSVPQAFTLVAIQGPYVGGAFPITQYPARIGRGSWATIPLNSDQGVSRQHAEIYPDTDGSVHIRDLNSTHGTFVNGMRVGDSRLNPGDRVTVGLSTFQFDYHRG